MSASEAVLAELEQLGALETVEGQLALGLAKMVDLGATGASVGAAANAGRCEALMEKLRARNSVQKSELDLARERVARRSAG